MRSPDYEPEHYRCSECKFYHNDCKRIDNEKIKFWKPWHQCDDRQSANIVCRDFELKDYMVYARNNWIDFDTYFKEFVENWLPYGNINKNVYFILDNNYSIRYGVPLMNYINGDMYNIDGSLKWVEKMYYKQTRDGFGYRIVREYKENG